MEALNNINLASLADTFVSLVVAFLMGALIGYERQYRQRNAGLRTNVLVAVGAAIFVDMANRLTGHTGAVHVVAYVVSGIGFLGAGVILREQGNVRGLNTAATLWGSAAVGACAGADLIVEAVLGTLFLLAANTLLRPLVNAINRQPLDMSTAEMTHRLYVITAYHNKGAAIALLEQMLEAASYPIVELDVHQFGSDEVEVAVTLSATSVNAHELDNIIAALQSSDLIRQSFWSSGLLE